MKKSTQIFIPKEGSQFIWVILINSVYKTSKRYYLQVFLEESKYVVKEKAIPMYILDNIQISPDSSKDNSDEENSHEEY